MLEIQGLPCGSKSVAPARTKAGRSVLRPLQNTELFVSLRVVERCAKSRLTVDLTPQRLERDGRHVFWREAEFFENDRFWRGCAVTV